MAQGELPLTFAREFRADNESFGLAYGKTRTEMRRIREACVPHYVAYVPLAKLYEHLQACATCQKRLSQI